MKRRFETLGVPLPTFSVRALDDFATDLTRSQEINQPDDPGLFRPRRLPFPAAGRVYIVKRGVAKRRFSAKLTTRRS